MTLFKKRCLMLEPVASRPEPRGRPGPRRLGTIAASTDPPIFAGSSPASSTILQKVEPAQSPRGLGLRPQGHRWARYER